ncbi:MAG: MATE family efflux transporter [Lachnospiraceae bacterium]|nr:MATE family efflux transporter [Lachnospiraceae bacterium]
MMNNVFEEKSIPKAVLKLGIPAMLGSLTTLIYNIADTYFVALTKEPAMIAAVTLCVPVLLIIMSIACIFGMGGSSVIARMIGEGRQEDSAKCFNFCTYAMAIVGLLVLVLGLLFSKQIAGIATSFGFVCASFYYLICLAIQEKKKNALVKMSPKNFSMEKRMVANVIKIGIPGALITVMLSLSNIVLNNFIGIYGSNAVASYGIAYKIDMFPIMLSVGLSQGTAPLVGYYYGQRNEKNLSKAMKTGTVYGMILGAFFTAILFFGNRLFAGVFLSEEGLIAQTEWFLRLLCFHAPLLGIINMVTAYFQALGKATNSLIITILRNRFFLFRE